MSQVDPRPTPAAVQLRSGPFPDNGLLPLNYRQRLNNEQLKERDLSDEKYRRRKAAAEGGPVYASPTCTKSISISLFFDGANNHEESDSQATPRSTSHIARLYHVAMSRGNTRKDTAPPKPAPCFSLCFRAYPLVPFPITARKELTMSEFATWRSSQTSLALLTFAMLLPAQAMGTHPAAEMVPAGVEGYNHTSAAINRFSVNRAGGHNIGPFNSYGGSQSCCASLPRQWRPGLMATVEWEKDPNPNSPIKRDKNGQILPSEAIRIRSEFTQHRAVVEIPRYESSGAIKVHFLPCDQVKVAANNITPGYPGYPYNFPARMQEPKTCPK